VERKFEFSCQLLSENKYADEKRTQATSQTKLRLTLLASQFWENRNSNFTGC
jgi:hypothetical protein